MFAIGDKVCNGAYYRGPGIIVSFFLGLDSQSMIYYVVAHKIDGGYYYNVYNSVQLTPAEES